MTPDNTPDFRAPVGGFLTVAQRAQRREVGDDRDVEAILDDVRAFLANAGNITPGASDRAWTLRKDVEAALKRLDQ